MKDGEQISGFMRDSTSNLRSVGRNSVYAIIATAWALSVGQNVPPSSFLLCSLIFAILYLAVDFGYFYYSAYRYNKLLKNYFEPATDGEMEYKNKEADEETVNKETKDIMGFGENVVKTMTLLLILSFVSLLISLGSMLSILSIISS